MTAPCGSKGKKCRFTPDDRRRGTEKSIRVREQMPKCGAKCRQTGAPCANPVAEPGKRCRLHGGATPSGKDWHRAQMPPPDASPKRGRMKLLTLAVRREALERRLAAMTPEDRERYDRRSAAMQPGTPAERRWRHNNREMREMLKETVAAWARRNNVNNGDEE